MDAMDIAQTLAEAANGMTPGGPITLSVAAKPNPHPLSENFADRSRKLRSVSTCAKQETPVERRA